MIIPDYQTKPYDEVYGHHRHISASDMPAAGLLALALALALPASLNPRVRGPRHTPWRASNAIRENREYM
jgi:hypothetical protein